MADGDLNGSEGPEVLVTPPAGQSAATGTSRIPMPSAGKHKPQPTKNQATFPARTMVGRLRKRSLSANDLNGMAVAAAAAKRGKPNVSDAIKKRVPPSAVENCTQPAASKATSRYAVQSATRKAKVGPASSRVALAPSHNENTTKKPTGQSTRAPWDLRGKISDLESKMKKAAEEIATLKEQLSERNEELIKVSHERDDAKCHSTTLEAENQELKASLDHTSSELEIVRNQLAEEREARRQCEATSVAQKLHISDLTARVEVINSSLRLEESRRRILNNTLQELKGNIRVFCRVRPLLGSEINGKGDGTINHIQFPDDNSLKLFRPSDEHVDESQQKSKSGNAIKYEFSFDQVFTPDASQEMVFSEISQLVQSALDGYNVCIFAYGQTGSGKTYTMEGSAGEAMGIIPRTINQIFATIASLRDKGWEYNLHASFLEIYNEQIRDLLSTKANAATTHEIKICGGEVTISNLQAEVVESEEKLFQLMKRAQKQRAVAATRCNEHSSRSHSIFRLAITGKNDLTSESCKATLNMVDLAGSERLKESGSEGERLTETKNINRSLSNLGNVIMALTQHADHVPFRNSKLTFLLMDCLGGQSKALMFVNLSPRAEWFAESVNSLRFAAKVKQCHIGTAPRHAK